MGIVSTFILCLIKQHDCFSIEEGSYGVVSAFSFPPKKVILVSNQFSGSAKWLIAEKVI